MDKVMTVYILQLEWLAFSCQSSRLGIHLQSLDDVHGVHINGLTQFFQDTGKMTDLL